MKTARFTPLVLVAASACLLPFPAAAQVQTGSAPTRLEVQARGEVTVVPDLVVISTGVVTQSSDAAGAMRENAARMSRLVTALKQAGVAARDVRTETTQLSPQYRYADNAPPAIIGYQASTSVSVQFRDIARSGAILDSLVQQGANQINGPSFIISDRGAAEDKAREAAVRQVQERAALYAKAIGRKVGRIVSLSEGGEAPSPVPMLMARAAAADGSAKTELQAGVQQVVINLSAVVELE